MRHGVKTSKLQRNASHRRALLANQALHAIAPASFIVDECGQSFVIRQIVGVFEPNHFLRVLVFYFLIVILYSERIEGLHSDV